MEFEATMELIARAFEIVGVGLLILGAVYAAVCAAIDVSQERLAYRNVRRRFGRTLLLALEILVAADIVQTVAVDFTLENMATLGILVLVRTVLSVSLTAEIEGELPRLRGSNTGRAGDARRRGEAG